MEFSVLGPVQLIGPGMNRINLASDAQRRLVGHLVLRANTVVRADELAEHLALSPGALRTAVSRLRRIVGFDTLVTEPPGYELRTDRIDALRFEQLVIAARSQPSMEATRLLRDALSLWHGEAYAEFAHEAWVIAEAVRLEELRAGAEEDLAAFEMERGNWADAISHLDRLIDAHPLRERPRTLLMRALASSGRRAEALREFQAFRRLLGEETGTDPSADLIALDRQIAAGDEPEGQTLAAVQRWALDHGFALVPLDS